MMLLIRFIRGICLVVIKMTMILEFNCGLSLIVTWLWQEGNLKGYI